MKLKNENTKNQQKEKIKIHKLKHKCKKFKTETDKLEVTYLNSPPGSCRSHVRGTCCTCQSLLGRRRTWTTNLCRPPSPLRSTVKGCLVGGMMKEGRMVKEGGIDNEKIR